MLLQLLITVASVVACVSAKYCENVNVRNKVSSFEEELRGCTVIVGNLEIALIDRETTDKFINVTFPELKEIKGYLLIYRVYGLTSLGQLFPNLAIIRGMKLFRGYSFILFDVTHLKEIGLHSLKYILRGSMRIERCPHLCYVRAINWSLLTTPSQNLTYDDIHEDDCKPCPESCKGHCWNEHHCQKTPSVINCHPECVDCTEPGSPLKCIECRHYNNSGTCVKKCPKEKFRLPMMVSCFTKDECQKNPLPGTWWTFQGICLKTCPPKFMKSEGQLACELYRKVCNPIEVNSTESAQLLKGCTHINGSLIIHIDSKTETDELFENLALIEEIDYYLVIRRSGGLTSLKFLKALRSINGKSLLNYRHSLIAFENRNLHMLWEQNHTVLLGSGTLLFHDNNKLCLSKIQKIAKESNLTYTDYDVSPLSNGDNRTCNYIVLNITISNVNATNVTLTWENVTATRNLPAPIGYLLSYTEDIFGNISIFDDHDECYQNIWESTLVTDNTTYQIINLNPFTQYAYYITLYSNASDKNGHTKIEYFTTLSEDPAELLNFHATSTTSDSVTLDWEYPLLPNGILGHYELVVYYERDDEVFITQRNFCKDPHADICCNKQHHLASNGEFEFTCDRLNIIMNADLKLDACKNYMYSIDDHNKTNVYSSNIDFIPTTSHKIIKRSLFTKDSPNIIEVVIPDPNITTYTVKPLKHFSMFIFILKVCHKDIATQCSSPVMTFRRTLPREGADDIPPDVAVHVNKSSIAITWLEPLEPNSIIVAYEIEHRTADLDNSKSSRKCLTRKEFLEFNCKYQIERLLPGHYVVRVRAISLAGPGKYSKYVNFEISGPTQGSSPSIALIVGGIVVVISTVLGLIYYYRSYCKNRFSLENEMLISNEDSDYTGPSYVEDEWEIDRENVDIYKTIYAGSFVTVHTGLIKSENRSCIVKSTSATGFDEKVSFLNATSLMKWVNGAHHVIKLLGVVSKGHQPLVLVELASEGDLKSYLKKLRTSSINTTPSEMYRMAAEIADGMVYLSSRRFVHRDLAARSCLVCADHTVKIGDYGINQDRYKEDYYRTETENLIPVRWMAPESLSNDVFTTDSNAWSYGVLLWEIATLAEQPFTSLSNEAVFHFVTNRGTLQKPPECPGLLYEIMQWCWKWRPNDRPLFTDIVAKFEPYVGQHFSLVSFYHSTEGEKCRRSGRVRIFNAPALSTPFSRDSSVRWHAFDDNIDI